jgi:M6 family metalloprotease-like protein
VKPAARPSLRTLATVSTLAATAALTVALASPAHTHDHGHAHSHDHAHGVPLAPPNTQSAVTPTQSEVTVCSSVVRQRRLRTLQAFERGMKARRRAYFRSHRRARARAAFVRRQNQTLAALRRAAARCKKPTLPTAPTEVVAEGPALAPPPPCSPTLFAEPGSEMSEATTPSPLPLKPGPSLRAAMIFVDFHERPASETTKELYDRLVPDSRAWLHEVSYGRISLDVTSFNRWYRMPRRAVSYGFEDGLTFEEHRDYIADAVRTADADVDFSAFEIVYVVAAKGSGLERSPAFHALPGIGIDVDGTELRYSATFGEDIRSSWPAKFAAHTLVHETGHLLGLPDLYDFAASRYPSILRFAGGWDTMSWTEPGSHYLAWHKWKLGWLEPSQLTCLSGSGDVTTTLTPLAASGGLKAVVVPTGPSSAYVIEARRRMGEDSRLCADGVLVYQVDATTRSGQGPIRVRAAKPDQSAALVERCGLLYDAPFSTGSGEVARFDDSAAGLSMQVLGSTASGGFQVRVTRA